MSGPLNDAAVAFIAGSGFASATIEKGQGVFDQSNNETTYAEDRIAAVSRQLKAANPALPTIAYFNS